MPLGQSKLAQPSTQCAGACRQGIFDAESFTESVKYTGPSSVELRFGGAGTDGLRNGLGDFIKRHSQMRLGMQHNQGRRAGILTGVMMVETQIQDLFQIGKTMPAIAFQFRPSAAGNPDAIAPAEGRRLKAQKTMRGGDGLFVKIAVLNEMVAGKQRQ